MLEADWGNVAREIRAGKLAQAISYLEAGLASLPGPRFRSLLGREFTNPVPQLARDIAAFRTSCEQDFAVGALYLEMNGFDINPGRWYFDYFGYKTYVDDEELDWLPEWDSGPWPDTTLLGLEPVQAEYDWYSNHRGHKDPQAKLAASYATPLVMCRFAELIGRAVGSSNTIDIPVLATAHDFDMIPRFLPAVL